MSHTPCPKCFESPTRITQTTALPNNLTRRRRWCPVCDHRWATHELTTGDLSGILRRLDQLENTLANIKNLFRDL